jgi:hypothetical protein
MGCRANRKIWGLENRLLRRMSGRKREEMTEGQRKSHGQFSNMYSSSDISSMMKSTRMRLVEHAAHTGKMRNTDMSALKNIKKLYSAQSKDIVVDGG